MFFCKCIGMRQQQQQYKNSSELKSLVRTDSNPIRIATGFLGVKKTLIREAHARAQCVARCCAAGSDKIC